MREFLSPPEKRPRLLLFAMACSPYEGSEGGIGWNRAVGAAATCDTWVITNAVFRNGIERYMASCGPIAGLRFAYVDFTRAERFIEAFPGLRCWTYAHWSRRVLDVARKLHEEVQFDLVHHANFVTFREPGYLWQLDAPFIWGPIGGTQNFPWRFLGEVGPTGVVREVVRNVLNGVQLYTSRRVRSAARKAAEVIAANSTNQEGFYRAYHVRPSIQLDTGTSRVSEAPLGGRRVGEPLHILWSGGFEPRKALGLLLKALARLPDDFAWQLRVLGKGEYERRWRRLARKLGIDDRIEWYGWLPHGQIDQQYAWADLFAFTSLRDTTGSAVPEALGAGLPVVTLDHQGVRDLVTDECGIKVAVTTPRQVIEAIAEAIVELGRDEPKRLRLAEGARRRGRDCLWTAINAQMAEVYRRVLARRGKATLWDRGDEGRAIETPRDGALAGAAGGLASSCGLPTQETPQ